MATRPNPLRLLITRPAEDCVHLANVLAAQGFFSDSLPLIAIEPLPESAEQRAKLLALDEYQAVLVVSKTAARLALERLDRYWPQPPVKQRWFSPGAGSGQLLRDYGLDADWPTQGDTSEAILALPELQQALSCPNPKALIICGEGGRTLLAGSLRAQGVIVDTLALYRRVLPVYPRDTLLQRIEQQRLNALYVSSEQGFRHLVQLAGEHWPQIAALPLFVPSARVAKQARVAGAKKTIDCRGASSTALLSTLHQYFKL